MGTVVTLVIWRPLKDMPRAKKQSNNSSQGGDNAMPVFVNCQMTDEQKAFVKANLPSVVEVLTQVEELLADNYKITLSFDANTDCFSAFLIGKPEQAYNSGLMLSAYAPVFIGAIAMLMYKHFTVLGEDWPSKSQGNNPAAWR